MMRGPLRPLRNSSDEFVGRNPELETQLAQIRPLLGRHLAFHRRLVDVTGNVKAALLLSQSLYWTRHGREVAERGGWFYKTAAQWTLETGLSLKEQVHARRLLRELSLIQEQRAGLPARLFYRVNVEHLATLVSCALGYRLQASDWSDSSVLVRTLGPTHGYHRILADAAGGVHPALLLSRALLLCKSTAGPLGPGWFSRTAGQWQEDLGLSRREQESARRELVRLDLWDERICGIPPTVHARPRLDVLRVALAGMMGRVRPGERLPTGDPDPMCPSRRGKSSLRESLSLVLPGPPLLSGPKEKNSSAVCAPSHIGRTTQESLQRVRNDGRAQPVDGDNDPLILPERLAPDERIAAIALVSRSPDQAQRLLDELAARLSLNGIRTSPLAYLRTLVDRALTGHFVPQAGIAVARARRERRDEQVSVQRLRDTRQKVIDQRNDRGAMDRVDHHRQVLQQLLKFGDREDDS